jgi:hypothetical protein
MKQMKKILLLLLALTLVVSLAACGETDTPEPTPTSAPEIPATLPETLPEEIEAPDIEEPYDENTDENVDEALTNEIAGGHTGGAAPGLTIERLEYQEGPGQLADVTFMHTIDLMPGPDHYFTDTLMIRTFTPLRDFAFIWIEYYIGIDEDIAIPVGTAGEMVDMFQPTEAFIIYGYVSAGTFPNSGITFLDENGQRFFFFIVQNQGYPETGDLYLLIEFQLSAEAMPTDWVAPW